MGGDLINIYCTQKMSFDKTMKKNKVGQRGGAQWGVWSVCSFRKWLLNRNLCSQLQGAAGTGAHPSALGTARRQAWLEPAKPGRSGRRRSYSFCQQKLTEFLKLGFRRF